MALGTTLKTRLEIKLQGELEALKVEAARLEAALGQEMAALSQFVTEKREPGVKKTSHELLIELNALTIENLEENLADLTEDDTSNFKAMRDRLIAIEATAEPGIWKSICIFLIWLLTPTPETRQALLAQATPHIDAAITLLEKKGPIDLAIQEKESTLSAENIAIIALKTKVSKHTSSKYETSDIAKRARQAKNILVSQAVIEVADALHNFLETPNEGSRAILSGIVQSNSGYKNTSVEALLKSAQAIYGGIEGTPEPTPEPSTLQHFKKSISQPTDEAPEASVKQGNRGRYDPNF